MLILYRNVAKIAHCSSIFVIPKANCIYFLQRKTKHVFRCTLRYSFIYFKFQDSTYDLYISVTLMFSIQFTICILYYIFLKINNGE